MDFGRLTAKSIMGVLAVIFWLAALLVWTIGIIAIVSFNHYDQFTESNYILVPGLILIAIGFVFFFAGLLGCYAGCRENQCVLHTFALVLFALLVLLIAAVIFTYTNKANIESTCEKKVLGTMEKYNGKNLTVIDDEIDQIQKTLHCCGARNYTDWANTDWGRNHTGLVPWSCCHNADNDTYCNGKNVDITTTEGIQHVYSIGCYQLVEDVLTSKLQWIGGAAIGLLVLMLLGLISSCILIRIIKAENLPYFNLESSS